MDMPIVSSGDNPASIAEAPVTSPTVAPAGSTGEMAFAPATTSE